MSEPKFEHTGAYCRDNGGGYDPDCWACDPSHFATLTAEVERLREAANDALRMIQSEGSPPPGDLPSVLAYCARAISEEQVRLHGIITVLEDDNRKLRAEVARLTKAANDALRMLQPGESPPPTDLAGSLVWVAGMARDEVERLTRELAETRKRNDLLRREREGEVWCWTGDPAEDEIESLTCPILIDAHTVRRWMARVVELQRERDEAHYKVCAASYVLRNVAKIEVPANAEPGTWVATTLFCNDQVTAYEVWVARSALGQHAPLTSEHMKQIARSSENAISWPGKPTMEELSARNETLEACVAELEALLPDPYGLVMGMDGETPEWIEQACAWVERVDAYQEKYHEGRPPDYPAALAAKEETNG